MRNKSAYAWGVIARLGPSFITLASNMILARLLVPSDFGTIGVLYIIFMVANTLVDSGLGGSLVKEPAISREDCSTITTFNIGIGCSFFVIIFSLAGYIEGFFAIDGLKNVTRLLSMTFLIGPLGVVPTSLLMRDIRFKDICVISLISMLLSSIIAIIMAYYHFGVYALVANQVLNTAFNTLLCCAVCKYLPRLGFSISSFKKLIPFGAFTTITLIIDTIYENLLTTITGKYLNVKQAGYLSQAKRLEESMSMSITKTINTVTFPIVTKLKDDIPAFRKEAGAIYKIIPMLTVPIMLTVSAYASWFLTLLFGERWVPATIYLQALIWAGIFMIFENLLRCFIKSLCAVDKLMTITIWKRGIGIGLIILFLLIKPEYIIYGYVLSAMVGFCMNGLLYSKLVGLANVQLWMKTIGIITPALVYYSILVLTNQFVKNAFMQIVIVVFLALIYVFGVMPKYGVNVNSYIKSIKNKLRPS